MPRSNFFRTGGHFLAKNKLCNEEWKPLPLLYIIRGLVPLRLIYLSVSVYQYKHKLWQLQLSSQWYNRKICLLVYLLLSYLPVEGSYSWLINCYCLSFVCISEHKLKTSLNRNEKLNYCFMVLWQYQAQMVPNKSENEGVNVRQVITKLYSLWKMILKNMWGGLWEMYTHLARTHSFPLA